MLHRSPCSVWKFQYSIWRFGWVGVNDSQLERACHDSIASRVVYIASCDSFNSNKFKWNKHCCRFLKYERWSHEMSHSLSLEYTKKKSDSNRFHLLGQCQLKIFTVQYLYRRRGYDVTEFYCMYFLLLSLCEFYFWHICGETDLWWWCGATHEMKYSRPIYVLYNCQYNTIGLLLFRDAMSEFQILRNISHIFQFKRNSSFQFLMTWWLSIYSFVSMHKMIDSYAMSHTPQSIQFTQLSVLTL